MTVRKIKNSWWVDFRHDYIRYRKKSPENSKSGAEAYEAVLRQKLAKGENLISPQDEKIIKDRDQKFKEFAWNWFEIYVKNNNKNSEIQGKKYTLGSHLIPFFGNIHLNKISTLQVEQYKSRKAIEGLSKKTINNHLTVLSTCLNTARDWLGLDKLPKIKKLKVPPPITCFLSQKESEKLIANSAGMWQDVIFAVLNTGLRRGELKALQWSDIDWNNRMLTVRHSWCERKKGIDTTKGNRERYIPLTDGLYNRLHKRRLVTEFVFRDETTQAFCVHRLNQEIRKACKKAGIKIVTCHTLRHTFASHLAMAGASLKAIQELLGHVNIQTTMRYAHLSSSTLRDAVSLLEPSKMTTQVFGQPAGNQEKTSDLHLVSTNHKIP